MTTMNRTSLATAWESLRTQWAERRLLRIGLVAVAAIVCVQGLLLMGDRTEALRRDEAGLRDELARVQSLAREKQWPQRAEDARTQLNALRSLAWNEPERGLAEASAQDWVRSTAAKSTLSLREVGLVRGAAVGAAAAASAGAAGAPESVRLRVTAEFQRLPLAAFLAEAARNERAVMVDGFVLRPALNPPQVEMELRMPWLAASTGAAR